MAAQVALARRDSPHRGGRHVGLAKALVREMPHTQSALAAGLISEWRVRARHDELRDRLLPVAHDVACLAVLTRAADAARAAGDERSRGQVMAGTLVAALGAAGVSRSAHDRPTTWADADSETPSRCLGGADEDECSGPRLPALRSVSVQLVMTDRTLLAGDDDPAHLVGYGTMPAGWARDLVRDDDAQVWLRRLFTHPGSGDLLAADSVSQVFSGGATRRSGTQTTSGRGPPVAGRAGTTVRGPASAATTPSRRPGGGPARRGRRAARHTVQLTTPTGHDYRSTAPATPGTPSQSDPPVATSSRLELHFEDVVLAC